MAKYCDKETIQILLAVKEAYPQRIKERVDALRTGTSPAPTEDDYKEAWAHELDDIIAKYSEYIDTQVGNSYRYIYGNGTQKFPDWTPETGTQRTPANIYEICRLLCLDGALGYYFPAQSAKATNEGQTKQTYRELAESELEKIRKGEVTVMVVAETQAGVPADTTSKGACATRENVMTAGEFCKLGK